MFEIDVDEPNKSQNIEKQNKKTEENGSKITQCKEEENSQTDEDETNNSQDEEEEMNEMPVKKSDD